MFIPIADENPRTRTPFATIALVGAIVYAWFFVQAAGTGYAFARSLCELGLIPGELTARSIGAVIPLGDGLACIVDADPAWRTVVTSMFMHGDWFHLIGNLWFLWLFGDNVEGRLGALGFVVFYLLCGVAAAAAQMLVDPASPIPMVGASGAISGVMGAYAVMFPYVPVRVATLLIIIPMILRVPAIVMLGYWFVLQLLGALPQLAATEAGVAFWAHVGGFVVGVVLALVWKRGDTTGPQQRSPTYPARRHGDRPRELGPRSGYGMASSWRRGFNPARALQ